MVKINLLGLAFIVSSASSYSGTGTEATAGPDLTCYKEEECDEQRQLLRIKRYHVGNWPSKGCFVKNGIAYWGTGGSRRQRAKNPLNGVKVRILCDGAIGPSQSPSYTPTSSPTRSPTESPQAKDDGWKPDGWKPDGWQPDGWQPDGWGDDGHKPTGSPTKKPTLTPTRSPISAAPTSCEERKWYFHSTKEIIKFCSNGYDIPHGTEYDYYDTPQECCEKVFSVEPEMCYTVDVCATDSPTTTPTSAPTSTPTSTPTRSPSKSPSKLPSSSPSSSPSKSPVWKDDGWQPDGWGGDSHNEYCLSRAACNEARIKLGFAHLLIGDYNSKGCYQKNGQAYWGQNGNEAEKTKELSGHKERIYCNMEWKSDGWDNDGHTPKPTSSPTGSPSKSPSKSPAWNDDGWGGDGHKPTGSPTKKPTLTPTRSRITTAPTSCGERKWYFESTKEVLKLCTNADVSPGIEYDYYDTSQECCEGEFSNDEECNTIDVCGTNDTPSPTSSPTSYPSSSPSKSPSKSLAWKDDGWTDDGWNGDGHTCFEADMSPSINPERYPELYGQVEVCFDGSLSSTSGNLRMKVYKLGNETIGGVHIHSGSSCDEDKQGGHYFKENSEHPNNGDPWLVEPTSIAPGGALYTTYGNNEGTGHADFRFDNGYGADDNAGHVIVIHDTLAEEGGDYARIACGVLKAV